MMWNDPAKSADDNLGDMIACVAVAGMIVIIVIAGCAIALVKWLV